MQKKRQLKTCIVAIALMCLLTISMTFQTICVKTISDNYINSLIVNQIIDLIIDEETDANFHLIHLSWLFLFLSNNYILYLYH